MAKTVIEDYVIKHEGKEHTFKQLWEAFRFCDTNGLLYPERLYEKEGQPHVKELFPFASDRRTNRDIQQYNSVQNQLETRDIHACMYQKDKHVPLKWTCTVCGQRKLSN